MDIPQQKYYKVVLIGDSCDDVYHYGVCERISPEAPVPILRETSRDILKGMSGNVRLNLEAFGLFVSHYTNTEKIRKHRFIDTRHNQHLLRWDEGEHQDIVPFDEAYLKTSPPDAVVISDYNKGFLPSETCCKIIEYFKRLDTNIPIFVDSKKTDLSCFAGCFIKINEKESESLEALPSAGEFIITLGESGALYDGITYPTKTVEVFDVCGAGDVFLSAIVYGFLKYGTIEEAIPVANRLASASVSHMGTYVLTKEDIEGNDDVRF
tara:strand:- start:3118 stop:3915 length:798 start_codon:yes stop_codon:yes gene_type:complete